MTARAVNRRLRGLIRKESLQILRDPSSLAIAFVLPIVLLIVFGYGVSLDAREVPLAIVVDQPDAATARFTSGFLHSEYFTPRFMDDIRAAEAALGRHEFDGILWLRGDFGRALAAGRQPRIGLILNGVNANQARLIQGYVEGVWQRWLQDIAADRGREPDLPVTMESRIWFNPAVRSRNFLVPGLVAVIMTLIGALLTAMVVAREWERGTLEAMMVTPIRVREILLGKLAPYFGLGMGGMLLTVALSQWLFRVPLVGSFWVLLLTSALFMLTALGMGLLISIVARNQFVAGQIAIIVTFLPAFILSGFIFDIGSMPTVVQWITHLVPARYFVAILQSLFLAGDVWSVILPNGLALAIMSALFLGMVRQRMHKRLD